ncbi:hypothetical protein E1261_07470 [Kribbella albertanoniae]|uniref:Uncharacterized protein n=1 Tax=Kribbella albertanoniae TaxID=1266829 RepID=A0A4R4QBH4_9ACTN|nr:hypothetical protein E1261_07470 [Kribbella albertanoniae]
MTRSGPARRLCGASRPRPGSRALPAGRRSGPAADGRCRAQRRTTPVRRPPAARRPARYWCRARPGRRARRTLHYGSR